MTILYVGDVYETGGERFVTNFSFGRIELRVEVARGVNEWRHVAYLDEDRELNGRVFGGKALDLGVVLDAITRWRVREVLES